MSKFRKTIRVADLTKRVNEYLRNTDKNAITGTPRYTADQWRMMRMGHCTLLESVLHNTDNYRGFGYVTPYTVDETSRHYY